MRTITVSLKELENFVVDFSVRADELAGVNGALTIGVGGAASGLFDDNSERREVPGLRGPVERGLDGAFGNEHVLPESTKRPAIARGVEQSADFCLVGGVLAGAGASGEDHRVLQLVHIGNVKSFAIAVGAFAAIGPPART